MIVKWNAPFRCIVSGPSGSGKTVFVRKFLNNLDSMVDKKFERILFYYAEWQDGYKSENYVKSGVKIEFRQGLPKSEHYSSDPQVNKLLILDDLMHEGQNQLILELFTRGSHHKNISVIFITQNFFHKSSFARDISLNASYIVLMKNPRDKAQINFIARQVSVENPRFLVEAFQDATTKPHGYLMIDCVQSTPDELRFRTCIFPDDEYQYIYLPKYAHSSLSLF